MCGARSSLTRTFEGLFLTMQAKKQHQARLPHLVVAGSY